MKISSLTFPQKSGDREASQIGVTNFDNMYYDMDWQGDVTSGFDGALDR